jgi:putative FmdB family regulatory protein
MPRYQYRCNTCEAVSTIFHLSDETVSECPSCHKADGLVKLLNTFSTSLKKTKSTKIGRVTEEFIEDARTELHKQRNELEKER